MENKNVNRNAEKELNAEELINEYNAQVSPDGKHTYIVSVYSDYSDTTCC